MYILDAWCFRSRCNCRKCQNIKHSGTWRSDVVCKNYTGSMKRVRGCESLPCYWSSDRFSYISLSMLKQCSSSLHTRAEETVWSLSNSSLQTVRVADFDNVHCFIYCQHYHMQNLVLLAHSILRHEVIFFFAFLNYVFISVENKRAHIGRSYCTLIFFNWLFRPFRAQASVS